MKKLFSIFMFVFLATAVSVTTFATELLEMNQIAQASNGRKVIQIVDASDFEYYVQYGGSYYIMLEQENWQNITVVSNGNMSSTYIEYDPETMFVINEYGEDKLPELKNVILESKDEDQVEIFGLLPF